MFSPSAKTVLLQTLVEYYMLYRNTIDSLWHFFYSSVSFYFRGSNYIPIKKFIRNIQVLWWTMSAIYSLSWESWLAYVAFIEGNFLQCGPQYIAVFGGTIPLLVRIMWALPMHYQGHFLQYTQDIIMEFLLKIHYYLPTLYSLVICLPYIHLYLLTLIPIPL